MIFTLSSTYCIAHLPSTLPSAKPLPEVKQLTTRVWYLRGLVSVLNIVVGEVRLKMFTCRSAVPTTRRLSFVSIAYTLSGKATVAIGFGSNDKRHIYRNVRLKSQYFKFLSQLAVARASVPLTLTNLTHLMG
jgi:hypothetical protein